MPYTIPQIMPDEPFRAYDIRCDTQFLTPDVVYSIARVIGQMIKKNGENEIIIGRDGRLSGPILFKALKDGLLDEGLNIQNLGIVTSPMLYFATSSLSCNNGVILTASHNPKNHNGLKIVIDGKSLTSEVLQKIKLQASQVTPESTPKGKIANLDISNSYIEKITQIVKLKNKYKVVVDCGNGAGSNIAPLVFKALGCDVVPIFCEIDGNFPNHHPDPSCPENMRDLQEMVIKHNADIGLAFDGDADRIGLVCNQGNIVWPDQQMMLFAQSTLANNPNSSIVYDVKCSDLLGKIIEQFGGKPVMWKTGHSLIKSHMRKLNAPLAGEMSGHIFFGAPWYGFDDGIFAGAKILEYLDNDSMPLDCIINKLPKSYSTAEIKIPVEESSKEYHLEQLHKNIPDGATLNDIDGLRLSFSDGWFLVRASNTTPCLTTRCEANSPAAFLKLQETLKEWLLESCPNIDTSALD